ncbi:MAG: hypothetical protein ABI333_09950 [bacterium]
MTEPTQRLYVVVDTKGSGRVLGVFDSHDRAADIVNRFPSYYKLYECRLNHIDPEVLGWADDDEQRQTLFKLIESES